MNRNPKNQFKKGHVSFNKGKKLSPEVRKKISESHKGLKLPKEVIDKIRKTKALNPTRYWLGKKRPPFSEETRQKMRDSSKKGKESHFWIKDRSKLKKYPRKDLDTQYKYWMLEVKKRDNWECKLKNIDCKGRLESHHILNWADYPELRYEINNGITLCAFHHPRGREKEKRMIPVLRELLSVSEE